MMRRATWLLAIVALLEGAAASVAAAQGLPKHLQAAIDQVQHLSLENTSYNHGEGRVQWEGTRLSQTDCSGFLDALLIRSYGDSRDDFKRWFGSHRPTAARYHDAIVAQKGFVAIHDIRAVRPGDILAVKYLHRKDNTGHVMLAVDAPRPMATKKPVVEGTQQWQVTVIDSSESGHGPTDTRHAKGKNGKDHDGLGMGVLRVYADVQGRIAGFTWSPLQVSKFHAPDDEPLVVGRLVPGFRP